ncbi:hypothetical protein [uncultured Thomasclavelia sp.]|uniref:hypothetical protein n=1 Tax=uncultured Thomasclavelia sp. TaxID=3025759 RepID=UPI002618AA3A|nr:hypothetical protein [uncultured Thomasclavelia sp.]
MANSRIVSELKKRVITDIINDMDIITALDPVDIKKEDWEPIYLVNSKETVDKGFTPIIYREIQNQNIITKTITFLCVEVNIPESYTQNEYFKYPRLEIWIVSHNKHNRIDNIPGVSDNRNDYVSILLDEKFNGMRIGMGTLSLLSNTAGIYDDTFIYRKLVFQGVDLDDNLCNS